MLVACAQVVQAVQSAEAAHGAVDMLICCAGAAELGEQPAQVVGVMVGFKPEFLNHMPGHNAMWLSTIMHACGAWCPAAALAMVKTDS